MRECLELGATPYGEPCEQLGKRYDPARARQECKAYIGQLRREFPDLPDGLSLVIRGNPHDYGVYYEVAARFDMDDEDAARAAYHIEENAPEHWDDQARAELGLAEAV